MLLKLVFKSITFLSHPVSGFFFLFSVLRGRRSLKKLSHRFPIQLDGWKWCSMILCLQFLSWDIWLTQNFYEDFDANLKKKSHGCRYTNLLLYGYFWLVEQNYRVFELIKTILIYIYIVLSIFQKNKEYCICHSSSIKTY